MNLIYYRGLNCHLASIVNIAASLSADYLNLFHNLWSETDFTDEAEYHIYTSKRVFENLTSFGFIVDTLKCTDQRETKEILEQIPPEELFFMGTDTFYLPWHPVYQNFHGPHFFFARKRHADFAQCFDPIYNAENIEMNLEDIRLAAFEVSRIQKQPVKAPKIKIKQEAEQVIRSHPDIQKKILSEIENCKGEQKKNVTPLINRVTAMINNRCLYVQFLRQFLPDSVFDDKLFSKAYFSRWEAVRNGLYKISILKENESVVDEVCARFTDLIQEEIMMAETIMAWRP